MQTTRYISVSTSLRYKLVVSLHHQLSVKKKIPPYRNTIEVCKKKKSKKRRCMWKIRSILRRSFFLRSLHMTMEVFFDCSSTTCALFLMITSKKEQKRKKNNLLRINFATKSSRFFGSCFYVKMSYSFDNYHFISNLIIYIFIDNRKLQDQNK